MTGDNLGRNPQTQMLQNPRGELSIMFHTSGLTQKGIPYPGFKYIKGKGIQ